MKKSRAAAARGAAATKSVRLRVHVQPRASRSEIAGMHGDANKVRLTAPPVDDAANEELVILLARALGLQRGAVRIIAGFRGRSKVVEVVGATVQQIEQLATSASAR